MKPIVYQLFVRLFGNKCTRFNYNGTRDENGCGKFSDIDDTALNALKAMHYSHIWYTGIIAHASLSSYTEYGIQDSHPQITKGLAGSPYAIRDYYDVDPDLCNNPRNRMSEFDGLINRTHNHGLKAIIDFVPNHVARQYKSISKPPGVIDFGETDDTSQHFHPQNNFYYYPNQGLEIQGDFSETGNTYHEIPAKATGNDKFTPYPDKNDWYETIKLNYGVDYQNKRANHFEPIPSTWKKMLDILLFWASKGVDGFRCDMAEMVPVAFWNWVIKKVKEQFPEIIFIAEIYQPWEYNSYISYGGFDYLYDKMGLYDTLRRIIQNGNSTHEISSVWQSLNGLDDYMLRFMENHDEQRLASNYFAGNAQKGIPAMAISALMNSGPIMVYNGQEDGENATGAIGFSGDDGRTSIFDYCSMPEHQNWMNNGLWDGASLNNFQKKNRNAYQSILRIASHYPCFSEGSFYDLMYVNPETHKQYAFLRYSDENRFLVIASFSEYGTNVQLKIPLHAIGEMHIEAASNLKLKDVLNPEDPIIVNGYDVAKFGVFISMEEFGFRVFEICQD